MAHNHFAGKRVVVDYAEVAAHVPDGDRSWVTIMTHAHREDAFVLERLVDRDYAYLGMMGSAAKVRQIFADLESRGIPRPRLERVHAPIGVAIGSHTPAEIAVSIAAEIIAVLNRAGTS